MKKSDGAQPDAAGHPAVIAAHLAECDACRATPGAMQRLVTILNASVVPVDATALSRRTLVQLQAELGGLALAGLWRKVVAALLLALVPLPAVLAYDAYLLRVVYGLFSGLLPATLAAYLIFGYAAFLVLLFATTYAAIPLFIAQRTAAQRPALG